MRRRRVLAPSSQKRLSRHRRRSQPGYGGQFARLNALPLSRGRLELYEADAAALPVADGRIDKAYCLNAFFFFFFPQPAESLKEMARALKPGGRLALITSPPAFRPQIEKFSRNMADNMRFDTPEMLARWAGDAGLTPIETREVANAGYLFVARKEKTP